MTWFAAGVIFVIVWWLVLFMVLPFGASPPDEVEPGMAPSAPARPRMGLKIAVTTVIAIAADRAHSLAAAKRPHPAAPGLRRSRVPTAAYRRVPKAQTAAAPPRLPSHGQHLPSPQG